MSIKVWIKRGVIGDLHWRLQKELGKIIKFYEDYGEVNFYITSKREGNHGVGSLHEIGRAVDFYKPVTSSITFDYIIKNCKLNFELFDFIEEGDHFHLELDPHKYV